MTRLIQSIIRDVAELPDRSSPDDFPEAMLVTADELQEIIERNLIESTPNIESQTSPQPVAWLEVDCIGERYVCFSKPKSNNQITPLYNAPTIEAESNEPITLLALNITQLQNRIEVLEDLLTSAAVIAGREGKDTHWGRFIGQLYVNGIGNITAKTFRILPSDPEYIKPTIEADSGEQAKIDALESQLAEVTKDRDEWKDATVSANQRFKLAESQLSIAVDALNFYADGDNIGYTAKTALTKINALKGE